MAVLDRLVPAPLRRLSLRVRALVLVGFTLAVVLAGGLVLRGATVDANAATRELQVVLQPAAESAQALLGHLVDQETGERGYVITGDRTFLGPYRFGKTGETNDITMLRKLSRDPTVRQEIDRVESAANSWRAKVAEPEIAARGVNPGQTRSLVDSTLGRASFDTLRLEVVRLQQSIDARRDAAQHRTNQAARVQRDVEKVSGALLLLTVIVAAAMLRRWVLVPLRRLQDSLRKVAGGELDAPVTAAGPPELRALAADAEAMRRRILAELEDARAHREALDQREPVVAELRDHLRPVALPAVAGLTVAASLHPAEGVLAGDWYDVLALPDGRSAVAVADVSGHGPAAGLVAVRLKYAVMTALRLGRSPAEALAVAAGDFANEEERFASVVVVEIDSRTGRLRWANAGHPPPLVVLPGRRGVAELGPTGPVLSSLGGDGWTDEVGQLFPGQLVVAYTDGVSEARDAERHELGVDGVIGVVENLEEGATAAHAVDVLVDAARAQGTDWRRDDATCVVVQYDAVPDDEVADHEDQPREVRLPIQIPDPSRTLQSS